MDMKKNKLKKRVTEIKVNKKYSIGIMIFIILMGIILIFTGRISKEKIGPDVSSTYAKATVLEIKKDNSNNSEFGGNQTVICDITSGKYKGKQCEVSTANSYNRGAFCQPGTKVILLLGEDSKGNLTGGVYNYDRSSMIWIWVILFLLCLCVIGGKKGVASSAALIYTLLCVIFLYIPLLYIGVNPFISAVITSMLILSASIFILNGWSGKTLCGILGTITGVTLAGLIAFIFGNTANLTGFNLSDVEAMLYIANSSKLSVGGLLFSGILISSLGAVMDVSVSITAAMQEIYEKVPDISVKELFLSGMNVGHDMMGTMSNTLILAYAGNSVTTIFTVYSYEMPYLQTIGYNSIIIELLRGISGTMGVILTVPIQAVITTWYLKKGHKVKEKLKLVA